MQRGTVRTWLGAVGLSILCIAAGCSGWRAAGAAEQLPMGGDPAVGRQNIRSAGCGACHTIPGIRGATGTVGPPLTSFARRAYIGGRAPNTPENLVRWLQDPRAIEPHTAMPDVGLDEQQARAIAAYLYTLR